MIVHPSNLVMLVFRCADAHAKVSQLKKNGMSIWFELGSCFYLDSMAPGGVEMHIIVLFIIYRKHATGI